MPANGIVSLRLQKISQEKTKGNAFIEELNRELSPESIASQNPDGDEATAKLGKRQKA